ncbi:MAG: glycosyltransferase [Vulcanisaeta sp.]
MLFDPIFGDLDIIMLSKKLSNGKYGFTHQSNLTSRYLVGRLWKYPRYSWPAISLYGLAIRVPPSIMNMHMRRLMEVHGKPRFVALLSKGQAEALSIDDWGVPYFILNPANVVDPELLNHRGVGKDDYLVFYARIHPEKGIFELPKIIKILRDEYDGDVKLKVMGAFPNDGIRRVFFSLVRRYGVENNIEYLGFVNEEEKHEIVAKAKVLIYPSHNDSFSLVILESLALRTLWLLMIFLVLSPYLMLHLVCCLLGSLMLGVLL